MPDPIAESPSSAAAPPEQVGMGVPATEQPAGIGTTSQESSVTGSTAPVSEASTPTGPNPSGPDAALPGFSATVTENDLAAASAGPTVEPPKAANPISTLDTAMPIGGPDSATMKATKDNYIAQKAEPKKPGIFSRLFNRGKNDMFPPNPVTPGVSAPNTLIPNEKGSLTTKPLGEASPSAVEPPQEPVQLSSAQMDEKMKEGAANGMAILEQGKDAPSTAADQTHEADAPASSGPSALPAMEIQPAAAATPTEGSSSSSTDMVTSLGSAASESPTSSTVSPIEATPVDAPVASADQIGGSTMGMSSSTSNETPGLSVGGSSTTTSSEAPSMDTGLGSTTTNETPGSTVNGSSTSNSGTEMSQTPLVETPAPPELKMADDKVDEAAARQDNALSADSMTSNSALDAVVPSATKTPEEIVTPGSDTGTTVPEFNAGTNDPIGSSANPDADAAVTEAGNIISNAAGTNKALDEIDATANASFSATDTSRPVTTSESQTSTPIDNTEEPAAVEPATNSAPAPSTAPVVPTMTNVLDQAGAVVASAEATGGSQITSSEEPGSENNMGSGGSPTGTPTPVAS